MLKFNHSAPLPGEQSNPTSSIYSSAFFSFSIFNFHIPYTLKVFVVFLTKLRFVVIKNEPFLFCLLSLYMHIHNIYGLAILPHIDLPHKQNWYQLH